jgi:hypothetical protein
MVRPSAGYSTVREMIAVTQQYGSDSRALPVTY